MKKNLFEQNFTKEEIPTHKKKVVPVSSLGTSRFFSLPFHRPISKYFKTLKLNE